MIDVLEYVSAPVLILSAIALLLFYLYFTRNFGYWKKRGIPYAKPTFFFGNLRDLMFIRESAAQHQERLYHELKGHPFGGIFLLNKPALLIRDPEIVRAILVKDFDHFFNRHVSGDNANDPLQARNIFSMRGPRWRQLRAKLSPTFTSEKIRRMFHLVCEVGRELQENIQARVDAGLPVDAKETMARFTTDSIATCVFGIQCHSLKNPDAEFRKYGRMLFDATIGRAITNCFLFFIPDLIQMAGLRFHAPEVEKFFRAAVTDTIEYREKNNVVRNDLMDLLIQLKNKGKIVDAEDDKESAAEIKKLLDKTPVNTEFDGDDVIAQAVVFFEAGFDTSSTTMCMTLYELALHPDLQDRLRDEIHSVLDKHGGQMSYEAILEMEYLDMVVSETLRKYPPLPIIDRICTKRYTIPGSNLTIDEGTPVFIPMCGIQRDPEFYPEPEKWDPERFTEENKRTRPNYSYMPFGEGPRSCIGMRLGLMQTKIGLVHVLSRYEIQPCEETPIPVHMDKRCFFQAARGCVWLKAVKTDS